MTDLAIVPYANWGAIVPYDPYAKQKFTERVLKVSVQIAKANEIFRVPKFKENTVILKQLDAEITNIRQRMNDLLRGFSWPQVDTGIGAAVGLGYKLSLQVPDLKNVP